MNFHAALLLAGALACCSLAHAQQGMRNGEWHYWGGDAGSTRYSSLDQIDAKNVRELQIAWQWQSLPVEGRPDVNFKATPLMIDGVLYTSAGLHQAAAIDPKSGATLWVFTPEPRTIAGRGGVPPSGRGVAYWSDGREKRVFLNTLDGRLISIDARTGRADPKFGRQGTVLLKEQLTDRPVPMVGSSSPPIVVGDVIVAQTVSEVAASNKEAVPGHIRGYDVRTGKLLWTFHTIPQRGEPGVETWEKNSWAYTGNTGVWTLMSADPELGYVYLPIETPSHDFYGGHRLGDNLYAESLVCLDARTGKRVWHFQVVHHGVWDYDPPAAPILGDITVNGRRIRSVTLLTKQAMSFVFDRVTGQPVWPIEERPVPASDVPGERLSPTQPFPTKPAPYERLGYHDEDLIDFAPWLHAEALEIAKQYVRGPMYTPVTRVIEGGTKGTWVNPGYGGGANWNGGAFDPENGMMYVPTQNKPMVAALTPADPKLTDFDYVRAATTVVPGPRGLPITKPPWSRITATDMNAGEHRWSKAIGPASDFVKNNPALRGLVLDFANMGQFGIRPSPLLTKTLLFLGEAGALSGDPGGNMFRAYDKATGAVVAEIELPSKTTGAPMTYMHQGKQYIVVAVSTAEHHAEYVALALSNSAGTQPAVPPAVSALPPAAHGPAPDPQRVRKGQPIFASNCAICHGRGGEGVAGGAPALTSLRDAAAIRERVAKGGVQMPAMRTLLTEEQIRDVSDYVAAGLPQQP
ncbi:MAG TPA: PQQ-binding-like beta-propeller repeat protein [Steroidobacteraceae bacterium]|nr:PQQ-binding-like beta-propeller repeat protein [Steroidobacteraceae bacterium]